MKLEPTESEKKLKEIQQTLGLPVKLSDVEKEKFTKTFGSLKTWMDDGLEAVLKMDRDQAYRYIKLLIDGLVKVDVDFVAGVDTRPEPGVEPVIPLENIEQPVEPAEPITPVVRPTKEQVDGWLDNLMPKAKIIANEHLDCIKQYLDPEDSAGLTVICNDCSMEKMAQCIRDEDPSFEDAGSIFMRVQTE